MKKFKLLTRLNVAYLLMIGQELGNSMWYCCKHIHSIKHEMGIFFFLYLGNTCLYYSQWMMQMVRNPLWTYCIMLLWHHWDFGLFLKLEDAFKVIVFHAIPEITLLYMCRSKIRNFLHGWNEEVNRNLGEDAQQQMVTIKKLVKFWREKNLHFDTI